MAGPRWNSRGTHFLRRWPLLVVTLALVVAATPLASSGVRTLHRIDEVLFNEALKDSWGRLRHQEKWESAAMLPSGLDDEWLRIGKPLLVAHALGEASAPGQNTLSALDRSIARGLRLLEVDVWLDAGGVLRCHHGPAEPAPVQRKDCTLEVAAARANAAQAWLVLDLKTDFHATGNAIARSMRGAPGAQRLIFQLYRPLDIAAFAAWASELQLPAPIVTAYVSRRSLSHVAAHAKRIGAVALTVPLERVRAIRSRPQGLAMFVHPVHDCETYKQAQAHGADGLYVNHAIVRAGMVDCPTS